MDHEMSVERHGPQKYVAKCICGWEGLNKKGTEFWQPSGGFAACFKHAQEEGFDFHIPERIDLDPKTNRGIF